MKNVITILDFLGLFYVLITFCNISNITILLVLLSIN